MNERQASKNVIKVSQALGFLLSLDDNHKMDRVKLIKLLWAADRLHLRKYGRTISESDYYAMAHGPVCSLALDIAQMDKDGIVLSDVDKTNSLKSK
ncbi:SocA family protein [Candidatus Saccharibacteria bacterium]|nr:SocA family protein [Candidatus Saccharibacteria bacterium]